MQASLIISTYNRPDALETVLHSVAVQVTLPDEVLIADDGSGEDTRELIRRWQSVLPIPLHHIWHEDKGFRAAEIRNKAIVRAGYPYIIQIDGDTILHPCFVKDHLRYAEQGCFLTASRAFIDEEETRRVIAAKRTDIRWYSPGLRHRLHALRLPILNSFVKPKSGPVERIYLHCRGCNISYWRSDALAINGYDESFVGWGREDSDFVIRLLYLGCKSKKIKFAAIQYHLYHRENDRGNLEENNRLFEQRIQEKTYRTSQGIVKQE